MPSPSINIDSSQMKNLTNLLAIDHKTLLVLSQQANEDYTRFPISKGKGKKRWIEAPKKELKALQKKILFVILYTKQAHHTAHGFVPNRSIVSNATPHIGQKWVANYDLKDFFPSTKRKTVKSILTQYSGINDIEAEILSKILTRNDALPQGAPSSPHIANLAMWEVDTRLCQYAQEQNLNYTRYADDLSFSGETIPKELQSVISDTLKPFGYRLAYHKSKILGQHKRQMVTGLVVNDKLNLPRPLRKRLRAIIHDIRKNGFESAMNRCSMDMEQLIGRISLQAMWDKELAHKQIIELADALGL